MSEHTPGKLTVGDRAEAFGCTAILENDGEHIAYVYHNGYARRLVAAWNFCDGVTTELIENAKPLARIVEEHGELLAACKAYIAWDQLVIGFDGDTYLQERAVMLGRANKLARAAIAKAEGKS